MLYNLARGHALSKGRNYINIEDVSLILKVVLSSAASIARVTIFDTLLGNGGELTTSQIEDFLNVSKPTALRTMTELKALGLVDMTDELINRNYVMKITLKDYFKWFLEDEFKNLRDGFKPTDNNNNDNNNENNEKNSIVWGKIS